MPEAIPILHLFSDYHDAIAWVENPENSEAPVHSAPKGKSYEDIAIFIEDYENDVDESWLADQRLGHSEEYAVVEVDGEDKTIHLAEAYTIRHINITDSYPYVKSD